MAATRVLAQRLDELSKRFNALEELSVLISQTTRETVARLDALEAGHAEIDPGIGYDEAALARVTEAVHKVLTRLRDDRLEPIRVAMREAFKAGVECISSDGPSWQDWYSGRFGMDVPEDHPDELEMEEVLAIWEAAQ